MQHTILTMSMRELIYVKKKILLAINSNLCLGDLQARKTFGNHLNK